MKKTILSFLTAILWLSAISQSKEDVANDQKKKLPPKEQSKPADKLVEKIKKLIKVFEPIVRMNLPQGKESGSANVTASQPLSKGSSSPYNSDGSANWGQQYNSKYGCYLDALSGKILDAGEALEIPESVDLIFAAYKSTGAYYLFTPNFAHNEVMADAVWGSASTDNPVKSWKAVNESEVAETTLTAADFNAIQNNNQLSSAISKARSWAGYIQLMNRFDNKVFALRVHLDNRKMLALILVEEHMGTDGSNGYLKIKVKVTGIDTNNDGEPDNNTIRTR